MRNHEKPTEPRCKAKVFVLLPAWKSNAVWANAACVGHPKNLEALRAAGADVEAVLPWHLSLTNMRFDLL